MLFLTLTLIADRRLIMVRHDDVRVLEEKAHEVFENGEWKSPSGSVTLVKLFDGSVYTVAEQAADILKQLEIPS